MFIRLSIIFLIWCNLCSFVFALIIFLNIRLKHNLYNNFLSSIVFIIAKTDCNFCLIGSLGVNCVGFIYGIPNIKSLNRKNKISFEIKDDETGVKKYDVFVNGNWHLFEYEPKRNEIFCDLNSIDVYGKEVNLEVIVEDLVGNKKTLIKKLAF